MSNIPYGSFLSSFSDPPAFPQNLTCIQEGEFGKVNCTWKTGWETHIKTTSHLWLVKIPFSQQDIWLSNRHDSQHVFSLSRSTDPVTHKHTHFHNPLSLYCVSLLTWVTLFCRVQGSPPVRYESVAVCDGTRSALFPVSGTQSDFSVWVHANNSLGSENSTVLSFMLNDIGVVVLKKLKYFVILIVVSA